MITKTFPLSGRINLSARLGHGSLVVHCVDDLTEARVELRGQPGTEEHLRRIDVQLSGPTLVVNAPRQGGIFDLFADRWQRMAVVDAEVTIPSGTALKISTITADVRVDGRSGGADIATGFASVHLADVDGDLRLRCGTATATVDHVAGSVIVKSGSGDARLGLVGGDLQCACGSGLLEAGTVRGALRSRSGSGTARVAAVYGDVDIATGSGPISLGLPAGVTAKLDVTTGAGRVHSDLPIEEQPASAKGAIAIRARTGSGDVHLFRAVENPRSAESVA